MELYYAILVKYKVLKMECVERITKSKTWKKVLFKLRENKYNMDNVSLTSIIQDLLGAQLGVWKTLFCIQATIKN